MISDIDWDLSLYANVVEDLQEFHDTSVDLTDHDNPFHQYGEFDFVPLPRIVLYLKRVC
jgi:hypothetical protein